MNCSMMRLLTVLLGSFLFWGCMERDFRASVLGSGMESGFEIEQDAGLAVEVDSLSLLAMLGEAKERFERAFGAVGGTVRVVLSGQDCDTPGFDFAAGEIRFCKKLNVIALGTQARDVVFREAFLGMYCASHGVFCSSLSLASPGVREALYGTADFFAFMGSTDDDFGENYFENRKFVRKYHDNAVCQGDAKELGTKPLVQVLIEQKYSLSQLAQEWDAPLFLPERWLKQKGACAVKF